MYRFLSVIGLLLVVLGLGFSGARAGDQELLAEARQYFKPLPDKPPALRNNPLTPAKIELGKMLYFDPRLSASHLISCNTCHNLSLAGVDIQETSTGHMWQRGPRNAPTVLNAVFNTAQFWDGRARDLEEQAKGPVQASVEMSNTPERVVATLKSIPEYVEMFRRAFPGEKDPVTFDNVAKAIEAFEATLLTPDAPFDRFLKGDLSALNPEEKEGLRLFMEKGCANCHNGVNVGGGMYAPFGVVERPGADILPPGDKGRFAVTKTASDEYVFKVPSLRNVALTYPYFHSGKVWRLEDAVAIMGTAQLGAELSPAEVKKITAFLRSLTGKQPEITLPILPPSTDRTPKPILGKVK
ncbi:cytochrome-c peroxidase [Thermosulfurimonas sp. F29]|uniref:cytochrome-c peroxidase n=1 Tax=Thermosulfurimonas sp. F29 TaxID=2867247 RepID=UPI001C82E9FF|nr:cytochrome-c peroxidase [Thermosulfurimonas sp. F29]